MRRGALTQNIYEGTVDSSWSHETEQNGLGLCQQSNGVGDEQDIVTAPSMPNIIWGGSGLSRIPPSTPEVHKGNTTTRIPEDTQQLSTLSKYINDEISWSITHHHLRSNGSRELLMTREIV